MEVMHDQELEFIGHEFRKNLIEKEYRVTANPSTSVNPTYN